MACYTNYIMQLLFCSIDVYVVSPQGGEAIDDVFGCTIMNMNGETKVSPLDTYNVHGSNKLNMGDGGLVSSVNHYT